jgi:hypothetical protein
MLVTDLFMQINGKLEIPMIFSVVSDCEGMRFANSNISVQYTWYRIPFVGQVYFHDFAGLMNTTTFQDLLSREKLAYVYRPPSPCSSFYFGLQGNADEPEFTIRQRGVAEAEMFVYRNYPFNKFVFALLPNDGDVNNDFYEINLTFGVEKAFELHGGITCTVFDTNPFDAKAFLPAGLSPVLTPAAANLLDEREKGINVFFEGNWNSVTSFPIIIQAEDLSWIHIFGEIPTGVALTTEKSDSGYVPVEDFIEVTITKEKPTIGNITIAPVSQGVLID